MILARDIMGVIGIDNTIPWDVPADMAIFRMVTKGKAVAMGRKTWDSLPNKPLPGRTNIIISSEPSFREVIDVDTLNKDVKATIILTGTVENAIALAKADGVEELVFIGGKSIYEQVINVVDEIHLSELNLFAPVPDQVSNTYHTESGVVCYDQDFEELGFKEISYEEVFDDGRNVLDYIRYARPLNR